jgi:hypothetical protein
VSILKKIIDNGMVWFFERSISEFKTPTFDFTKKLMRSFFKIKNIITIKNINGQALSEELVAVYDLRTESVTYDFAFFIASAEAFMIKNFKKTFVICFIVNKKFNIQDKCYEKSVNSDSAEWRFNNIILPLVNLYPACDGYSVMTYGSNVFATLKEKLVYPDHYDGEFYKPVMDYTDVFGLLNNYCFTGFKASKQGVYYVELWMKERNYNLNKVVTITLRSYGYDEKRNSNVDAWIDFSKWVEKKGYVPLFIMDTDASFLIDEKFDDRIIFNEISWNMGLRVALYEVSYLNFVSHGPASVAQLNRKSSCISMKLIVNDSLQANEDIYKGYGMNVGDRGYVFAGRYQLLSWKDDELNNIVDEFNSFNKLKFHHTE